MDYKSYQPESWRSDDGGMSSFETDSIPCPSNPGVRDRSLVLDLLGRINYQILHGHRVYIESAGIVYKALYGGYWRSVFTGIEHYILKCEEVSATVWSEDDSGASIDLPVEFSNNCWTTGGHSLSFMLARQHDGDPTKRTWHDWLLYHRAKYRERARSLRC